MWVGKKYHCIIIKHKSEGVMGGVEGREERTGKKAIVFGMSNYNRTLNCSVCIVSNLFMNNPIFKQSEVG